MKTVLTKCIIYSSVLLSFLSCGSDSSSNIVTEVNNPTLVAPKEIVLPESSSLIIKVKYANTDLAVEGANVKVIGSIVDNIADTIKTDANGIARISLNQSKFTDFDKNGFPDEPVKVSVIVDGDDFLGTTTDTIIDSYGENSLKINVINILNDENNTAVTIKSTKLDLRNVEVNTVNKGIASIEITSASDKNTNGKSVSKVQIPISSEFIAKDGTSLDISTLEIKIIEFDMNDDSTKNLIPGGLSPSIKNATVFAAARNIDVEEAKEVLFESIGIIAIEISDGKNHASKITSKDPISLSIPISKSVINPTTGTPVKSGDSISVWSLSENDISWIYEGEHSISTDINGNLIVDIKSTHLSYFNLAYANVDTGCDSTIRIIDHEGISFKGTGKFIIDSNNYHFEELYDGDGILSFSSFPNEPSILTYIPDDDTPVALINSETSVELNTTGSISSDNSIPIINGFDICQSGGKTIAFQLLQSSTPVINVTKWIEFIDEGNAENTKITVELFDAPDTNVSFTLSVIPYGTYNSSAQDGEDFIAIETIYTFENGITTIDIPINIIDDDTVEYKREMFNIILSNPSNGAIFHEGKPELRYTSYIIDDDKLNLENITYTASEKDEKAVISFQLDKKVPEDIKHLYLNVKASSLTSDTATEMKDFGSKTEILDGEYSYNSSYIVNFTSQTDLATLEIPIVNDKDIDPNETFSIEVYSGYQINTTENFNTPISIIIEDDENSEDLGNVESYDVKILPLENSTNDNKNLLQEGSSRWIEISLNKATDTALSLGYYAPQSERYKLGDSNNSGILNFDIGEASKLILVTAVENSKVEKNINFDIIFTSQNLSGPSSQNIKLQDNDYDYIFISENHVSDVVEGLDEGIDFNFIVNSNFSPVSLNINSDFTSTTSSADFTVMPIPSQLNFSLAEGYKTLSFKLNDDEINEFSEKLVLDISLSPLISESENLLLVTPSCYEFNPTPEIISDCSFKTTTIIGDNDKAQFFAIDPGTLKLEAYSDKSFDGYEMNITIDSKSIDSIEGDIIFSIPAFEDSEAQIVTLNKNNPSKTFTINISPKSVASLIEEKIINTETNSGSVNLILNINISEESKKYLKDSNIEWILSKADINIKIDYNVVEHIQITGATGGN